jgi:hypothetical protein
MTDVFDEREKAFEAKYKLEEEKRFKAEARRNKLLGLWAAKRMGMKTADHEAYAAEVVRIDLTEPGVGDVVRKVAKDFADHGIDVGDDEILAEINRLNPIALAEVSNDYPDPLGNDHERAGG